VNRFFSRPLYPAIAVSLVALIVYLQTMAPGVGFIDDGELATVCYTLGIAHPTGYPLFTLIGWVCSHVLIAGPVILRLNVMAAIFTACGTGMLVLVANELYQHWMPERVSRVKTKEQSGKGKGQRGKGKGSAIEMHGSKTTISENPLLLTPYPLPLFAAIGTGLAAAFSATWWSQSTTIEVYPVHLFMLTHVLFFFLRMLRNEETDVVGKWGKLFALFLGLSFSNHMTTILLAPACLYMFFARYRFTKLARTRIVKLTPYFIAGLLAYLYLPIRSAMYPPMDWGHPTTVGAFLRHITGGQYKIWMFTGSGAAAKQWAYFWQRLPHEFTIVGVLLALAGLWAMFMSGSSRRTHVLIFTLLLFFGCLLYSINYDIHDIDSYFLLAYLAMSLWIGAGIQYLVVVTFRSRSGSDTKTQRDLKVTTTLVVVALALFEIASNYSEVDESGNYMVDDYTNNVLRNLPPNAIIFSTQWDFWVSGAFYYQLVEKVRPDVLVIDKAMLRDRPWYFAELDKRAPDVFTKVKAEENAFLLNLWKFDRGEKFDEAAIAPAYQQFTEALVERNLDRPIYITQEMLDAPDDLFAPKMRPVPAGLAYRLVPNDTVIDASIPKLQWRDKQYRKRNYYTDDSRTLQAMPLVNFAQLKLKQGDKESAKRFLDAALLFTPDLEAKLDDLNERDRGIAESANERFTQIRALRASLGH
jgi:hypothetical protein